MEEKRQLERNWWRQEKERRRQERQKVFIFHIFFTFYKRDIRFLLCFVIFASRETKGFFFSASSSHFALFFSFQEEEIRKEEERRESTEREEAEFVKSVRETGGGVIGLVNKTNKPVTFTSLRLLMERSQVKT